MASLMKDVLDQKLLTPHLRRILNNGFDGCDIDGRCDNWYGCRAAVTKFMAIAIGFAAVATVVAAAMLPNKIGPKRIVA